jgi:hypothetical protein
MGDKPSREAAASTAPTLQGNKSRGGNGQDDSSMKLKELDSLNRMGRTSQQTKNSISNNDNDNDDDDTREQTHTGTGTSGMGMVRPHGSHDVEAISQTSIDASVPFSHSVHKSTGTVYVVGHLSSSSSSSYHIISYHIPYGE